MTTGVATNLPTASASQTRRDLVALLRPRRVLAAVTTLVLIAATVAGLAVPALLGRIVDAVIGGRDIIDVLAMGILAALVVRAALSAVGAVLVARLGEEMLAELRERVVDRALRLPLQTLERAGSGDLMARVSGDVAVVSTATRTALPALVVAGLDVSLTLVGLAALDWRLALAGLAPAPVWVLSTRWYLRRSGPQYAAERVAEGRRTQALLASISGAATVRAFRLGPRHLDAIAARSQEAAQRALRSTVLQVGFSSRLNLAELVGVVSILATGFALVRADVVSVGTATAAALYFLRLFDPIGALLYLLDEAQSAGAALARLVGVPAVPTPPARAAAPADASVSLTAVSHAYEPGHDVLHDVHLHLRPGERVALVGTSGAGKSTVAALVAGLQRPTAGAVLLGGEPVDTLDGRHVCLVTQEVHVFAGTVADDLRLARPRATDAEVSTALQRVGALGWVSALPMGQGTVVGEGGHPLSPTQSQQLALARLVLADPAVALLDEATAEAGSAGARVLETAADAALAGRTALVIAHRLTQAAAADRVVVLEEGKVVESGTHDELVAAGGGYAALWVAWTGARG